MSSILHNSAALSALQSLNMTQQSLNTVQNQVSTGLAVATAADNSSYWSVAAQLNQDDGVVTAANTALTEGQSMLSTANSAINSVITTLNSMATALTEAKNPNANLSAINTSLHSLGSQLTDAVNNASFNGLNILNGTVTTGVGATSTTGVNFVSGYNATSNGGTVNTIGMATQMVYGTARDIDVEHRGNAAHSRSLRRRPCLLPKRRPVTGVLNAFATAAATASPSALTIGVPTVTALPPFSDNADSTNSSIHPAVQCQWHGHGDDLHRARFDWKDSCAGRRRHHRVHGRGRRRRLQCINPDLYAGGSDGGGSPVPEWNRPHPARFGR